MKNSTAIARIASRAAANLVAVVAIAAIFGLKTYMTTHAMTAQAAEPPPVQLSAYDPYLTEQP